MATIKGKWVFKDEISGTQAVSQNISFISNGINYSIINLVLDEMFGTPILYYGNTIVFDLMGETADFEGWLNDEYRTADFGSTEQTVSDAFRTFMDTYATPEAEPAPTDAVTIEYNGAVIASLKAGQSATLECKDLPMLDNVVVTVPEMGGADVPEWDGSYTISGGTISFTIGSVSYEAEDGMTWLQWMGTPYNTAGWYNITAPGGSGHEIAKPYSGSQSEVVTYNEVYVLTTDVIIADAAYGIKIVSGGGGGAD